MRKITIKNKDQAARRQPDLSFVNIYLINNQPFVHCIITVWQWVINCLLIFTAALSFSLFKLFTPKIHVVPSRVTDQKREKLTTRAANTMDTIERSFMRILMAGPEVSLKGSPTVSPTTADL